MQQPGHSLAHSVPHSFAEESEADAARLMDKEARISQLQERVVKAGLEVSRLASEAAQVRLFLHRQCCSITMSVQDLDV
jgi:hypothetical protein